MIVANLFYQCVNLKLNFSRYFTPEVIGNTGLSHLLANNLTIVVSYNILYKRHAKKFLH